MKSIKTDKITRLTVVDEKGIVYSNHDVTHIEMQLQDEDHTLKIFVSGRLVSTGSDTDKEAV